MTYLTQWLQFASDYGFKVQPCIAGRPQTKAKVEAPMKLLDEIRAYNGLLDYAGLNELVLRINNRVNHEVHAGTGRIPILYYQKEKASLSPLPKDQIRKPFFCYNASHKFKETLSAAVRNFSSFILVIPSSISLFVVFKKTIY